MMQEIKTVDDVKDFFNELKSEGLNFHPDTSFADYVNIETGLTFYTEEEVKRRDGLLNQAFEVCDNVNIDIYEIGLDIFMVEFNRHSPRNHR